MKAACSETLSADRLCRRKLDNVFALHTALTEKLLPAAEIYHNHF